MEKTSKSCKIFKLRYIAELVVVGAAICNILTYQPVRYFLGFDSMIEDKNILIFNATNHKYSSKAIELDLLKIEKDAEIEIQNDWLNKWVMKKTRIFYIGEKNKNIAEYLEEKLEGEQELLDYYLQLEYPKVYKYPDKPDSNKTAHMIGFHNKRDIVIFVGDDYANMKYQERKDKKDVEK